MNRFLFVGGLVAMGFDATGEFLLAISHDGRGIFSTRTWELLHRDYGLAYPVDGTGVGIGSVEGEEIPITELDYDTGTLRVFSPDGQFVLDYQDGTIEVKDRTTLSDRFPA